MRIIFAASTAFHLRHLALELLERGWDVEFHSYLPRWKTRQYGLPDRATISHFAALLPWSGLALLRGVPLQNLRESLFAKVDRRIARTMGQGDVFIGLSAIAVESAEKARASGALVLIERGLSHILHQRAVAQESGQELPSDLYVQREIASYALADRIVVLSHFALRSFVEQGENPGRLELTPLGADLGRFHPGTAQLPGPVRALYAGVWSRRKGCDQFAALLEAEPELDLVHVGTVGDLPLLNHPRFRSVGHQPQSRLAALMRERQLFVFPTRDDGFGMVMAEALACGMRVAASDASGAPDLAEMVGEEYVTVFPAGSAPAFHAAVRAQIAMIGAAKGAIAAPPQLLAGLSWKAYGDRYDAMLHRLLSERG